MTEAQLTLHKQYLAVFDGPVGKAVLDDLMAQCKTLGLSFNPDPMRMAFNEGARAIGLYIHNKLDTQAVNKRLAEQGDKKHG